jgi:hypothetical protein
MSRIDDSDALNARRKPSHADLDGDSRSADVIAGTWSRATRWVDWLTIAGFANASAAMATVAFAAGPSSPGILVSVAGATSVLLGIFAVIGVLRQRSVHREFAVRKARPEAIVFTVSRPDRMQQAVDRLAPAGRAAKVPLSMTASADTRSFTLWAGGQTDPHRILELPWSTVAAIETSTVHQVGFAQPGIEVRVQSASQEVTVPVQAIEAGLLGMYQLPARRNQALVEALQRRRANS